MVTVIIGHGSCTLLKEYWMGGNAMRFALVGTMPFVFCVSLVTVKPAPNPEVDNNLPHITIQMPVYKESLTETIAPSCESLKKAMQTYARQGGTSSIMICDDGMQLIEPELAAERRAKPDGCKRAGRFKKASNMNHAFKISLKLEEHLKEMRERPPSADPRNRR
ncbi:hypothetical protein CPB86DRAFT_775699 [Serendipita vermifera]|nr:hypothetical protein CPB86DRAFT_775699 [Serendipita vermifera]